MARVSRVARSWVAITLTFLFTTSGAQANGRFPEAQTFESVPGDDRTMYLRTTFGILVSKDGGGSWRWICERALGYDGQWDPPIAVTRDGRLWVGLEDGLVSTRSDGCDIEAAKELDTHTVKDLTTDPRGETLWAITGAPGKPSYVWRKAPGERFERLAELPDMNLMTIEVAPSAPSRIVYVSGQPYTTIRGQILRSTNGGKSFQTDLGDGGALGAVGPSSLEADGPMFIGAVDQDDPLRLLVRHLHAKGSDLLLSRDGGKTFKNVLTMTSAMFGFTKTADKRTFFAGSGLAADGIFRSTDRGETFESVAKHGVLCLHASGETLFACDNAVSAGGFAIAVSRDQGKTITPTVRFSDVVGPIECPTDARASLCASGWEATRATFTPPEPSAGKPSRRSKPAPRARSCGCVAAGTAVRAETMDLVLFIAGIATLIRGRLRGSKLTRRIEDAAVFLRVATLTPRVKPWNFPFRIPHTGVGSTKVRKGSR